MHMFILFLSIYPVQCVSIIIQYNITASSSTAVYLTTCILVIVQNITTLLLLLCIWCTAISQLCVINTLLLNSGVVAVSLDLTVKPFNRFVEHQLAWCFKYEDSDTPYTTHHRRARYDLPQHCCRASIQFRRFT